VTTDPSPPPARPNPQQTTREQATSEHGAREHATREVLDAADVGRALTRIAHQLLERNRGSAGVVLLGIPTRGVPLAARLAELVTRFDPDRSPADGPVEHGSLDIALYRDDLRLRPARALAATDLGPRGVDGAVVVLVDDVLFSGRSVRAALSALDEFGRPRAVQLAVLVDRGHREFPIRADYVGKNLPTSRAERVRVRLTETDGLDSVTLTADDSR
jgi:pyrimidine operon attenuation protein/uracil phosphoribosyltransferase